METGVEQEKAAIEVVPQLQKTVNYASFQNSVPLLRRLTVSNSTETALESVILDLATKPAFCQPRQWRLDHVAAGADFSITNCNLNLDPDYLAGLNEAERGQLIFRLHSGGNQMAEHTEDVRLLARNEWGGFGSMALLSAAFVMPNDPGIATLLKEASTILREHGHDGAMNGYQSDDPKRTYLLASSIWSAVSGHALSYAEPPSSFEKNGQKTRLPSEILSSGLATCFDTSLLFAAALEGAGLNPVLLFQDGHSQCGVWLVKSTFPNAVETDPSEIRKAMAAREFIATETTLVTHSPPSVFEQAVSKGRATASEAMDDQFVGLIDIRRARSSGVTPLASHTKPAEHRHEDSGHRALPLGLPPDLSAMPTSFVDEKPTTQKGRIDRWQRKLLDLSLRNRLLNFKLSKQTVPLKCPDIAQVEDFLADEKRLRVLSLPEQNPIGDRDREEHFRKTGTDLDEAFVSEAFARGEVCSPLGSKDLRGRLTALYRTAKSDLLEGGTNTLFLAAGFLKWKKSVDDTKAYRAPLLLIPVSIERRSATSPFSIRRHEDETRFNLTLSEMLKRDFDVDLPPFDIGLPEDESGVDVPLIMEMMRRTVRDIPGFEVVDEVAISTFSFAKYLMWKDLVDRTDKLKQNRVVKHLVESPDQVFDTSAVGDFPEPRQLDRNLDPTDVFCTMPADSSQLAAVVAAEKGQDFVLIGPPGTGKSQTIANMIGQCLANRKTVLFVAEKTAALNVVHRRLQKNGLGTFCLELHSNKADRRSFIGQLDAAWNYGDRNQTDWVQIGGKIRIARDDLSAYAEALHQTSENGLSVFDAIGRSFGNVGQFVPDLAWDAALPPGLEDLERKRDLITKLALTCREVKPVPAFQRIGAIDWSIAWQKGLFVRLDELEAATHALDRALSSFAAALTVQRPARLSFAGLRVFATLASMILNTRQGDVTAFVRQDTQTILADLTSLEALIADYRKEGAKLVGRYAHSEIPRVPVDEIEADWRRAKAGMWPASSLAKRKVTRHLQTYSQGGPVDVEHDLPILRSMQTTLVGIGTSSIARDARLYKGFDTDFLELKQRVEDGAKVYASLFEAGKVTGDPQALARAVVGHLRAENGDTALVDAAPLLLESVRSFVTMQKAYTDLANSPPFSADTDDVVGDVSELSKKLREHQGALKTWSAWSSLKTLANAEDLAPFTAALEAGSVSPDELADVFEVAFARWWLPLAIDRDERLRKFQRYKHEDVLASFRDLDEKALAEAAREVQRCVRHDLPGPQNVPRQSELGLLRHQAGLRRPSSSIRQMIERMPDTFPKLAPCVLMSPLSIAQYLPAEQALFDVVIFDEASQIATWDAVGAIARAKQTIIVGDPMQMPPSNRFGRSQADDDEEIDFYEADTESILDEASVSGVPKHTLRWHYRSRHEGLIRFSNYRYYNNELITFPSPYTPDESVKFCLVNGVYDRGKSRINATEARAIVDESVGRMRQWLTLPEDDRLTLAIVTFNSQQQQLILDLMDSSRRDDPDLEWFFSDDRVEPTIVKNLENIQGDERDVVFFSVTYGPDHAGKLTQDFGDLKYVGGERRLNVAVTRAREEMVVFSSITADKIDLSRAKSQGVKDFKLFLDYAERGEDALASEITGSVGGYDSPFEKDVAEALCQKGWSVETQIGVSDFRIDLGVLHPDKPGCYLAGVECDGATYHRSATARDRDLVRENVLTNLGWSILRVWSTDWFHDRRTAADHLHTSLEELLNADRRAEEEKQAQARAEAELSEEKARLTAAEQQKKLQDSETDANEYSEVDELEEQDFVDRPHREDDESPPLFVPPSSNAPDQPAADSLIRGQNFPAPPNNENRSDNYRRATFEAFQPDPDGFFSAHYQPTLAAMVRHVLQTEAPVRDDLLARRISNAHSWQRTGSKIRAQIDRHLKTTPRTEEPTGAFLWHEPPREVVPFRFAENEDDRRGILDISKAELRGLLAAHPYILETKDPASEAARFIGVARLTKASRARLEEVIDAAFVGRSTGV